MFLTSDNIIFFGIYGIILLAAVIIFFTVVALVIKAFVSLFKKIFEKKKIIDEGKDIEVVVPELQESMQERQKLFRVLPIDPEAHAKNEKIEETYELGRPDKMPAEAEQFPEQAKNSKVAPGSFKIYGQKEKIGVFSKLSRGMAEESGQEKLEKISRSAITGQAKIDVPRKKQKKSSFQEESSFQEKPSSQEKPSFQNAPAVQPKQAADKTIFGGKEAIPMREAVRRITIGASRFRTASGEVFSASERREAAKKISEFKRYGSMLQKSEKAKIFYNLSKERRSASPSQRMKIDRQIRFLKNVLGK